MLAADPCRQWWDWKTYSCWKHNVKSSMRHIGHEHCAKPMMNGAPPYGCQASEYESTSSPGDSTPSDERAGGLVGWFGGRSCGR